MKRDDDDATTSRLRATIREELAAIHGLKKNGDTALEYIKRIVTPERVMLTFLLVYQLGGEVRNVRSQLDSLAVREKAVTQQQAHLSHQMQSMSTLVQQQGELLLSQNATVDELMVQTDTLRRTTSVLDDRINNTVTRSEFAAAVTQRILPRLDRIERTLETSK